MRRYLSVLLIAALLTACGSTVRQFPMADPMTEDPDSKPYGPPPADYFSGFAWDGLDQTLFRPLSDLLYVRVAEDAVNVNAMEEVPDSSWFTNRLGKRVVDPKELLTGDCKGEPPINPEGPWTVIGAKPNGANPGFIIKAQDGRRYLLKFDGKAQQPRATASDTIVSKLYWAAGYNTPCNQIVFFDRDILRISPKAKAKDEKGNPERLANKHLDLIFDKAVRLPDKRYRASASLFLSGRPIGPFRYEDTRDDDPNDVIDHADRRDLRGASVLASWVNHFDSREQNTLDMFVGKDKGYIKHYYIDFGDCFGSLWDWDALSRRWGHSYVLDFADVGLDLITLGILVRPWDKAKYGASGDVFAYFNVEPFDPGGWKNEYPNPAFSRMKEADAAWMARIMARFTDEHIDAAIKVGHLKPAIAAELSRILKGRRDKILRYWFRNLSPLTAPTVTGSTLCMEDLAVTANVADAKARTYTASALTMPGSAVIEIGAPTVKKAGHACVPLPSVAQTSAANPAYLVVDIVAATDGEPVGPARVHLYQAAKSYKIVGLERNDK